jgi:hypothetical protein
MRNCREGGIRTDKADDWGVAAVIALGVRFPLPFDVRPGLAVSKQDHLQAYDSSEMLLPAWELDQRGSSSGE